jgi:hypothetical protein
MVDVVLYPLDTVKTRLQSEVGFWQSGGFKGVYRGLSSAAAGSAPCGKSQRVARTAAKKKNAEKRRCLLEGALHLLSLSPLSLSRLFSTAV